VPDPAGLAADFSAMMAESMGKRVADVLRIWTPQYASMFLKQVAPAVEHLTSRRTETGPQVGDYPTGAWGPGESRDYHLGVQVPHPGAVRQQVLAARVSLVAASPNGPEVLGEKKVLAIWTDDEALSTRITSTLLTTPARKSSLSRSGRAGSPQAGRQGHRGGQARPGGGACPSLRQQGNGQAAAQSGRCG
jgi:hypothetical protein